MSYTEISMDWSDTGAVVSNKGATGRQVNCPRCQTPVPENTTHYCGDRIPRALKKFDAKPKPRARKAPKTKKGSGTP